VQKSPQIPDGTIHGLHHDIVFLDDEFELGARFGVQEFPHFLGKRDLSFARQRGLGHRILIPYF
jgi:hypothetical protein